MNTLFDSQASWFTVPAIVATFFFLLKLVLMMVGGGLDMDMDGGGADFGGDVGGDFDIDAGSAELESDAALKVLSLQVVAAAIMGFGWGGFSALKGFGMDIPQSVFVGLLVGVAFGWGVGVAAHALGVFEIVDLFGPDWEKKQIARRMKRR